MISGIAETPNALRGFAASPIIAIQLIGLFSSSRKAKKALY
jgi:hypothetical protein